MAYTPTLADLDAIDSAGGSSASAQVPQQTTVTPYGTAFGLGADALEGIGQHAIGVGSEVGKDALSAVGAVAPKYLSMAALPAPALESTISQYLQPKLNDLKNADAYKAMGIDRGIADDVAIGAIESIPAFRAGRGITEASNILSKAPSLSRNTLGVGLYDLQKNPNDPVGAVKNALTWGPVGAVAGKLSDALIAKPMADFVSRQSVKPLANAAIPALENAIKPQDAAKELKGIYQEKENINNVLWGNVDAQAKKIDALKTKLPDSRFNSSPYDDYIDNFENNILSKTPAQSAKYEDALGLVDEVRRIKPQNIQDVVSLRQNLNNIISEFSEKKNLQGNAESKKFLKGLKGTFEEIIEKNIPAFAKEDGALFKKTWQDANKSHQELNKFYTSPSKIGVEKPKDDIKKLLKQGGTEADGAILSMFSPAPGQTGTSGFDSLADLVGKEKAQDYLKGYMFRKISSGNSVDAVKIFKDLSEPQQKAIFGDSKEGKLLKQAAKIYKEIDKDAVGFWHKAAPFAHHGAAFGLPAVYGFGAAKAGGMDTPDAALVGLGTGAAAYGAGSGIARLAPRYPGMVDKTISLAKNGTRNNGQYSALGAQGLYNSYFGENQ